MGAGVLLLSVSLIWLLAGPASGAEDAAVQVRLESGRLSLDVRGTPLGSLLAEIGRLTGVRFHLAGDAVRDTVTISSSGLDIEQALQRVLRDRPYVLVYGPDGLVEVRVYGAGGALVGRAPATPPESIRGLRPDRPGARAPRPRAPRRAPVGPTPALTRPEAVPQDAEDPEILEQLLDEDEHAAVTAAAMVLERTPTGAAAETALAVLAGAEAPPLEPVLRFARTARDRDLRIEAIGLAADHASDHPEVRSQLAHLAREDPDPEVRETARDFLEQLDDGD